MQQMRILIFAFLLFLGQTSSAAEVPIVRFLHSMDEQSSLRCGVLLSEDSSSIRFLDLKTQQEESIDKTSIRAMKNPLTEQEATILIGAVPVTGWSIRQALPPKSKPGLIADVDGREAYLNIGKESQVQVGQQMTVRREGEEIVDPETGEILGKRQQRVAEVLVTEVQERLTKVRIVGNPESDLKIGDSVHFQGVESAVAVLPLSVEAGSNEDSGKRFASEVTSYLSKNGVELVERTKLDDVIRELALVDTGLVNPEAIQKIGRLAEAFAVVTGEVQPVKKFDTYNVRLVEVSTGKILYSTSLRSKRENNLESKPIIEETEPPTDNRMTSERREKAEGVILYLSDVKPVRADLLNGLANEGRNGDDKLLLGGKWPHKGLGTHPDKRFKGASVVYELPESGFNFFRTTAGVHDDVGTRLKTPLVFEVWGDSELLWQSPPVEKSGQIAECRINISGVRRLELRVNCPGSTDWAWAGWGDPRLTMK